jgi:hypothetical protein
MLIQQTIDGLMAAGLLSSQAFRKRRNSGFTLRRCKQVYLLALQYTNDFCQLLP